MNVKLNNYNRMIIPDIITEIQKVREERWGIQPFHKAPILIAKAKSINNFSKGEALSLLDRFWLVKKEDSVLEAETVDFLKEFEHFSWGQRKNILKCLYAIELINGCNGNCYFCLFGQKKKISKKYSFESLKNFYKKYSRFIPKRSDYSERIKEKLLRRFPNYYKYLLLDLPQDKRIAVYWDGDPFCYQDGQYTLIDAYNLMVNHGKGKFCRFLSTSIPPGSQKNFVVFFEEIAREYCSKNIELPLLRISVAKHNIQRIEVVLKFLYYYLLSLNLPQEKIIQLFNISFIFHIRDEFTLEKIGPLFAEGDKFRDVISPQCKDGVVFCPGDSKVQIMTAANRFFPAGVLKIPLNEKKLENQLVASDSLMNYAYHIYGPEVPMIFYDREYHYSHILKLISKNKIFVRLPKKLDGSSFVFTKKKSLNERIIFTFSRYIFSLKHFIGFSSKFDLSFFEEDFMMSFFLAAQRDFKDLRQEITQGINLAQKQIFSLRRKKMNSDLKDIKEITDLMKFYLAQVDLLMEFIDKKKKPDLIIAMAKLLFKFGEPANKDLNKIIMILEKNIFSNDSNNNFLQALGLIFSYMEKPDLKNIEKFINITRKLFSYSFFKKFLKDKSDKALYEQASKLIIREFGTYKDFIKQRNEVNWQEELISLLFKQMLYFKNSLSS